MEITEKLYVTNRKDWRAWLEKNHNKKKEIWLLYYKKHTGKPTIPYDDAVEEAICFGWIDSTVKRIDDEKHVQRYTPRKPRSIWSDPNVRRAEKMINQSKMAQIGLEKYKKMRPEEKIDDVLLKMSPELKKALMKNKKAWSNYQKMSASKQKMYKWFIINAKREDTRKRRIKKAVKNAELNHPYPYM